MGRRLLSAFKLELEKIKHKQIKDTVKKILVEDCPDYICKCSTASGGKYHPSWANGEGGLIRHTKAVCKLTETIMNQMPNYDGMDWDVPYVAALLHDMAKYTEKDQKWSHQDHPILMTKTIGKYYEHQPLAMSELDKMWARISHCVETHMSRWYKDKTGKRLGTEPSSHETYIVAHADYIASQKWIIINFDEHNNIVE